MIATGEDSSGDDSSDDEDDKNEGAGNNAGAQDDFVTFDDVSTSCPAVVTEIRFQTGTSGCFSILVS